MRSSPKISLYSFDPYPGDVEGNGTRIAEAIRQAKEAGSDLVVFPEMSLPGYCLGDLHRAPSFVRTQWKELHRTVIPATRGITAVVGLTIEEKGRLYNGYAVLQDGRLVATGKKTLLINDGVLEDSRFFRPGHADEIRPVEVEIRGRRYRLGILICQDMWSDGEDINPAMIQKERGADLLVVLNASPFYLGKTADRYEVASRRVRETGLPLYYVNASGLQDIGKNLVIFDGEAFAITPGNSFFKERFIESFLHLDLRTGPTDPSPHEPYLAATDELHEALHSALRWFWHRNPFFSGAVIGLSGGIDSAVDAVLAAEVFGPDSLVCINMPSRHNSETTRSIAARIAGGLGCRYIVHPIQELVDLRIRLLSERLGRQPKGLTRENIQARARGDILMEYSQELGYMVIGNGNKTEFQRGYATLYGDIVGALMPLGDVTKVQVFELAAHLIESHGAPIPSELLTLRPSAELSDAQDIEKGGGDPFDYWVESPAGAELVEHGRTPEELVALFSERRLDPELWRPDPEGRTVYEKFSPERFGRYIEEVAAAIRRSYFKRVQAPPIPVVSRRAFGLDLRESLFPKRMY